MAVFIEAILPSGRGLRVEKLATKKFRIVQDRVANRMGENKSTTSFSMALSDEMLRSSLVAITAMPIAEIFGDDKTPDIDKMLDSVPADGWIKPTYEELTISDGSRSMDVLLEDVSDYTFAQGVVQDATFPNRGRAGSLSGKTRMASVES